MKKRIIWIILFAIASSCNQEKEVDFNDVIQNIKVEEALNNRQKKKLSLSNFLDTIKYIPLETTPDCCIDEIQEIDYYKNNYYIFDYNKILKFNSQGKFVCEIGNRGNGPNEYMQNRGCVIHSDTLFVNAGVKIVAFNTKDGSYLDSYPFPNRIFFNKTSTSFVTLNSDTGFIEFIDKNGSVFKSLNYEKFGDRQIFSDMIIYPFHNIFFGTNESLKISTSHNDTIFELNNNHELVARYTINLGKYKLPDNKRLEYSGNHEEFDEVTQKLVRTTYLETKNYLFIQFGNWLSDCSLLPFGLYEQKANMIGLGIFNKNNSEFSIISQDKEKYPCFYPLFSDGKDHVLSFVNPIEAITFHEQNKNRIQFNRSYDQLVKNLKIDDNPVIIIAQLKE